LFSHKTHLRNKLSCFGRRARSVTARLTGLNRTHDRREADLFARLGALNRQLVETDAARLALQGQLERSKEQRERTEDRQRERSEELQRRVDSLESDRRAAWERVRELEASLGRASARRSGIEDQLEQLRARLERERNELQSQLDFTHANLRQSQQEAHDLRAHSSRLLEAMQQAQRLAEAGGSTLRELGQRFSDDSRLLASGGGALSRPPGEALAPVVSFASMPPKSKFETLEAPASRKFRFAAGVPLLLGALVSGTAVWEGPDATNPGASLSSKTRPAIADHPTAPDRVTFVVEQGTVPATGKQMRIPAVAAEARMALAALDAAGSPASEASPGFDAALQRRQQDLLALGFDLGKSGADGLMGKRTREALKKFRRLYLAPVTGLQSFSGDGQLVSLIRWVARRAREDAERLNISSEVLAAIQLSHMRTGVAFDYLAELAAVESRFNPATRSATSTAAGLYQFTEETWLQVMRAHGGKYGLGDYASSITRLSGSAGAGRFEIGDPELRREVLDLRYSAAISALMAAEFARDNRRKLAAALGRDIDATDLYFAHFLGTADAIAFLSLLQIMPEGTAAKLFPEPARANGTIFHSPKGVPRTVAEVYSLFDRKFDTGRYQGWDPAVMLADLRD
jgi:hypothetical protein